MERTVVLSFFFFYLSFLLSIFFFFLSFFSPSGSWLLLAFLLSFFNSFFRSFIYSFCLSFILCWQSCAMKWTIKKIKGIKPPQQLAPALLSILSEFFPVFWRLACASLPSREMGNDALRSTREGESTLFQVGAKDQMKCWDLAMIAVHEFIDVRACMCVCVYVCVCVLWVCRCVSICVCV